MLARVLLVEPVVLGHLLQYLVRQLLTQVVVAGQQQDLVQVERAAQGAAGQEAPQEAVQQEQPIQAVVAVRVVLLLLAHQAAQAL